MISPNNVNIAQGQSVTFTVQPMRNGLPGGTLPGPVTWTNNANLIGMVVTFTPNGNSCTLTINNPNNGGTFSVIASSGTLSASQIVNVEVPADDMQIMAGPVA